MSIDYIVASLPVLSFDAPAPLAWDRFLAMAGAETVERALARRGWVAFETRLRNAMAAARGRAQDARPTSGCSLFWQNRVLACFQEKDVARREELLDRVWWDAAGELTEVTAPLGAGALATYAIRLKLALKRATISTVQGNAAFDRLTAATKITF